MSEVNETTTTETVTTEGQEAVTPPVETVSKADLERALKDLHKYKSEALTLKQQLELDKTAKMKEQNQWKELAEANEAKAMAAEKKAKETEHAFVSEKKYGAVLAKCQALGMVPEAANDLDLLDLSDVQVETTSTGKINILGAEKFAERLKMLKPHWFAAKQPPAVNANGQRTQDTSGTITTAMILTAEKEGRKSGDMSKYHGLVKQFQTQKRA